MSIPAGLLSWVELRFTKRDSDGNIVPNVDGTLTFYETDGVTPKDTYSDPDLDSPVVNPNPITINSEGRPDAPIYLGRGGYTVAVKDDQDVLLYTIQTEDSAGTFFAGFGITQTEGSKDVSSGYQILASDNLITLDQGETTNPALLYLPPASDRDSQHGFPIVIKNLANVEVHVIPNGADLIDGVNLPFIMPVASQSVIDANRRVSIWLASDGVSKWWVMAAQSF